MKKLSKEPILKFLSFGLVLYLSWFLLYEFWIHPMKVLDDAVIANTLALSRYLLNTVGFASEISGDRILRIAGTPGLFLGDSCNGISLFALYSIFIIAFPGKMLSKFFFIPLGIIVIHLLNVLRVVLLAVIETYSYSWTEFNHTYTFNLIIYSWIFFMWLYWINKFSGFRRPAAP